MGEKDITEKILADYNDVFADIMNGLLFAGEQRILPEALENTSIHSQYKAEDEKVHELERDVAKYWKEKEVELAICGIENQSVVEKNMPFRVIGYDGTAYRSQLLEERKKILPVVTIVLYFGTDRHWNSKKNIKSLMEIPEGLDKFVNDYSMQVFEIAWLTEEEIENVSHLSPIHDIGKIRVPIEILNKNGKLTADEMGIVKQHPLTGAEMTLRFPRGATTEKLNKYSYEICRYHHERYDGSGYPDGLKGDEIPLCAQIVGLVDAYDALVSVRPYKRKLKHEEAIRMIANGECGVFSKKLLQCFIAAAMQKEWIKKADS